MWALVALIVYSVQWLGVVLGVGAESVLLVAHLLSLHERAPNWLENVPSVRTVQRWGLVLIVVSGGVAVFYQVVNGAAVLLIPTFGFKWLLVALCALTFWVDGSRDSAWLEGFAGATWLALFVIHSVAPIFMWPDLFFLYGMWVAAFYAVWWGTVHLMRWGSRPRAPATQAPAPQVAPVRKAIAPKPAVHKDIAPPPPPPAPRAPVVQPILHHERPRRSLWQGLAALFGGGEHAAPAHLSMPPPPPPPRHVPSAPPPPMARASQPVRVLDRVTPIAVASAPAPAPVPVATVGGLPAVEYLELEAPHTPAPVAAQSAPAARYVPDYANLPGVRVMPQRPEDLAQESRAPIVQPA